MKAKPSMQAKPCCPPQPVPTPANPTRMHYQLATAKKAK